MKDFETSSPIRMGFRTKINELIEAWVHGSVHMLAEDDLKLVRRMCSGLWDDAEDGVRKGHRYLCFCAEVNLALGKPGALRSLRSKSGRKPLKEINLTPEMKAWAESQGEKAGLSVKMVDAPVQADELGPLFG